MTDTTAARPQVRADDQLYTDDEVRRGINETLDHDPVFGYYSDEAKATMSRALLSNVRAYVPSRLETGHYLSELKRLRTQLQHNGGVGRLPVEAVNSALRLGLRDLMNRVQSTVHQKAQERRSEPDGETHKTVLYTRGALITGLNEAVRVHPVYSHYQPATKKVQAQALLDAIDRLAPHRPMDAFLQDLLSSVIGQGEDTSAHLREAALQGGRSLFDGLKRRAKTIIASAVAETQAREQAQNAASPQDFRSEPDPRNVHPQTTPPHSTPPQATPPQATPPQTTPVQDPEDKTHD